MLFPQKDSSQGEKKARLEREAEIEPTGIFFIEGRFLPIKNGRILQNPT